ncbi:MAG: amino acid ABC transporter permease [Actinobacteria bacterium]|nr:amino acid ABC transporter permease [Actinomycetota bacterium]
MTFAYVFQWEIVSESAGALAHGLRLTLELSALAFALSLVLGLAVAVARLAPFRPLNVLAYVYTQVFRALSLYIYVLFIYFGIAAIFGINFGPFAAGVVALTLLNTAYMAEIYRAALLSIEPGQREAALALGLPHSRSFASVIFPQAFRTALPSLVNQLVDIVKDSSVVAVIGLLDLMGTTIDLVNNRHAPFELYTATAVTYVALILVLSALAALLERRLARHVSGGSAGGRVARLPRRRFADHPGGA